MHYVDTSVLMACLDERLFNAGQQAGIAAICLRSDNPEGPPS